MNVKAVERRIAYMKDDNNEAKKYMFVMQPIFYNKIEEAKVIKEAAVRANISEMVMTVAYKAMGEVLKAWATEGHSVAIPGLGTMRFGLRAEAVEKVDDVKSSLIKSRRLIFTPSVELKQELASTSVSITCIDRNGKIVKSITSSDDKTVEDPDESTDTDKGNAGSQGGGSQTGGGSSQGSGSQGGSQTGGSDSGDGDDSDHSTL